MPGRFDPELLPAEWFDKGIKGWFDDDLIVAATGKSQALAITLDDVTVAIAQTAQHPQSLAITLDDVVVLIQQVGAGAADPVSNPVGAPGRRARKSPIWLGDRLADLIDGEEPEILPAEEAKALIRRIKKGTPVPKLAEIRATAKMHGQERAVMQLFQAHDYQRMLMLYQQMQEEDDIETLLMLL